MRTFSRFILFVGFLFATAFAVTTTVHCQDQKKSDTDRIIITVGAGADELNDLVDTDYEYAIKVAANARIIGYKTRLGGKFVFDKLSNIQRYSFGPELAYYVRYVGVYGHFLVGFETINNVPGRQFTRTVGGGFRINLGDHVVVNPFQFDSTRGVRAPFGSPGVNQFSASVGVRF